MSFKVTVTFYNAGPHTIWARLAEKLGREPTGTEAKAEVLRILSEVTCDLASAGCLPHQRGIVR